MYFKLKNYPLRIIGTTIEGQKSKGGKDKGNEGKGKEENDKGEKNKFGVMDGFGTTINDDDKDEKTVGLYSLLPH